MADYRAIALQDAQKYGIPPEVFLAQINQESGFNPNARSGAGALGIAQFIPSTARAYGVDPMNPISALDGAARYDARLLKQYGGVKEMLSAYNSGRPNAYTDPNFAGGQTYNYVRSILSKSGPKAGLVRQVAQSPQPGLSSPPGGSQSLLQAPDRRSALLGYLSSSLGNYAKTGNAVADPAAFQNLLASPQQQLVQANSAHPLVSPTAHAGTKALAVVDATKQYLGTPYVWGGESPKGFDCSGLLQYVWKGAGVNIPRTTYAQFQTGRKVSKGKLQPGDAVFFTGSDPQNGLPGHVGMYIGDGKFIEAPHTGAKVQISTLAGRKDFVGGRRYA